MRSRPAGVSSAIAELAVSAATSAGKTDHAQAVGGDAGPRSSGAR